jgi:hypothetical protein
VIKRTTAGDSEKIEEIAVKAETDKSLEEVSESDHTASYELESTTVSAIAIVPG